MWVKKMRKDAIANPSVLADYIDGVWALKQTPADDSRYSRYDWYVLWHIVAMMTLTPQNSTSRRNAAHSGPVFLTWHRFYLKRLQNEIGEILGKPDFEIPYWNWIKDGKLSQADQRSAPIWAETAMGGSGSPLQAGKFKFDTTNPTDPENWVVRIEINPSGPILSNRGLNRQIGVELRNLPSLSSVLSTISRFSYDDVNWDRNTPAVFRNELEGWRGSGMHNRVHRWIGGDMGTGHSPNDPVFFLNHCNVDRIWAFWQNRNGANLYRPDDSASQELAGHRLSDNLLTLQNDPLQTETIADMLNDATAQYDDYSDLEELVDSAAVS